MPDQSACMIRCDVVEAIHNDDLLSEVKYDCSVLQLCLIRRDSNSICRIVFPQMQLYFTTFVFLVVFLHFPVVLLCLC